jgi:RimJ/RimL family protein N-acetyltransferase
MELKPITPEGYGLCAEWMSDPSYMGNFYNIYPETHVTIGEFVEESQKGGGGAFFIWDKEKKEPIGTIGYFNPFTFSPMFSGLEIWYQVHHSHRGKRVATQATSLLVNHIFNAVRPPVNRIQATVVKGNEASRRVLEHSGMKEEGTMRGVWFLHGEYHDEHLYSILRSDWGGEKSYRINHDF